eukprot:TRINITY_DN47459_c0_g1_i2.p2 TRINITY_DN47459_c0_g1~~TRINITY_DN47459_c0_g1_i2.p2  ORF type:complete len:352 (+),score=79.23 TRINITY_DN47459_c0_g1_i2:162-1217(+)
MCIRDRSYEELLQLAQSTYMNKLPKVFELYYIDFEDDKIFITSSGDLDLFLNDAIDEDEKQQKSLKIYIDDCNQSFIQKESIIIQEKTEPQKEIKISIHINCICDGCGMNPIIGIRYKCSVCKEFNYCENCEMSKEHEHLFLKIKDSIENNEKVEEVKKQEEKTKPKKVKKVWKNLMKNCQCFMKDIFQKNESYQIEIIGKPRIIPEIISTKTQEIYATLQIKNTGKTNLPKIVNIQSSLNPLLKAKIPQLQAGKYETLTIILPGSQQAGIFVHELLFSYQENKQQNIILKYPVTVVIQDSKQLEKEEEKQIQEKAQQLSEISSIGLENCLELVRSNQNLDINALINKLYE